MNVGERIKNRRKELGISVDVLAEMIGKNRATIYRYESEEIENLPITILEPLSKALSTTPAELMGWDETNISEENNQVNNENKLVLEISSYLGLLNETGIEEAVKRIKELTYIPIYIKDGGK